MEDALEGLVPFLAQEPVVDAIVHVSLLVVVHVQQLVH